MKRIVLSSAILTLASLSFAQQENCTTTLKFLATSAGNNVKMSYNGGNSFQSVFGGLLRMKLVENNVASEIFGYCADVKTNMASGAQCYSRSTSNDLGEGGKWAAYLINKYAGGVLSESNAQVRNDKGMALQLVVWEALTEESGAYNLAQGNFRAKSSSGGNFTTAQKTLIDNYMADRGESVATYFKAALDNCEKPVSQGILTPVPEPTTIGALSIGALALIRRRKSAR